METLATALGPAFAAGLAIQQLLDLLDPFLSKVVSQDYKKIVLTLLALVAGLALAFWGGLHVLEPLGIKDRGTLDHFVTGLIISGGTQGINSILKFMGYAKEERKADAVAKADPAKRTALADGKVV